MPRPVCGTPRWYRSEPTPARIRQHVRKIIQLRMAQGELDDCELTMRDLAKIEDAFVRVLAERFRELDAKVTEG